MWSPLILVMMTANLVGQKLLPMDLFKKTITMTGKHMGVGGAATMVEEAVKFGAEISLMDNAPRTNASAGIPREREPPQNLSIEVSARVEPNQGRRQRRQAGVRMDEAMASTKVSRTNGVPMYFSRIGSAPEYLEYHHLMIPYNLTVLRNYAMTVCACNSSSRLFERSHKFYSAAAKVRETAKVTRMIQHVRWAMNRTQELDHQCDLTSARVVDILLKLGLDTTHIQDMDVLQLLRGRPAKKLAVQYNQRLKKSPNKWLSNEIVASVARARRSMGSRAGREKRQLVIGALVVSALAGIGGYFYAATEQSAEHANMVTQLNRDTADLRIAGANTKVLNETISHIETAFERVLEEIEITNLVESCDRHSFMVEDHLAEMELMVESLLNHKAPVGAVQMSDWARVFWDLHDKLARRNQRMLIGHPRELFGLETSYTIDKDLQMTIIVHIPVSSREPMDMFRRLSVPVFLDEEEGTMGEIRSDQDYLAISADKTRYREYADLSTCTRMGTLFLCEDEGLLSTRDRPSCLMGLFLHELKWIQDLCRVEPRDKEEMVIRVRPNLFYYYTPEEVTLDVRCPQSRRSVRLNGANEITVGIGCEVSSRQHVMRVGLAGATTERVALFRGEDDFNGKLRSWMKSEVEVPFLDQLKKDAGQLKVFDEDGLLSLSPKSIMRVWGPIIAVIMLAVLALALIYCSCCRKSDTSISIDLGGRTRRGGFAWPRFVRRSRLNDTLNETEASALDETTVMALREIRDQHQGPIVRGSSGVANAGFLYPRTSTGSSQSTNPSAPRIGRDDKL